MASSCSRAVTRRSVTLLTDNNLSLHGVNAASLSVIDNITVYARRTTMAVSPRLLLCLLAVVVCTTVCGQTPCNTGPQCANNGLCIDSTCYCCSNGATMNFEGNNDCTCSGGSDPCAGVSCGSYGSCSNGQCQCTNGYSGSSCQTAPANPCANVNCGSYGTCSNGACDCSSGYSGSNCQTPPTTDPCVNMYCGTFGTCFNGQCQCSDGYSGSNCLTAPQSCTCSGCTSQFTNIAFNNQQNFVGQCNAGPGGNYIGITTVNVASTDGSQFRVFTRDVASPYNIYVAGSALSSTTCYDMVQSTTESWTVMADEWQFAVEVLCDTPSGCNVEYDVQGWGCYINNDPTYPGASASVSMTTATVYSWQLAGSGSCSATCGGGTQQLTYQCEDGFGDVINSAQCSGLTQPPQTSTCNTLACSTYSWGTSDWSSCSVTCGSGTQTRTVTCQSSSGDTVSDSYCTDSVPASSQPCSSAACTAPTGTSYCICSCCEGNGCTQSMVGYAPNTGCSDDCGSLCRSSFYQQCPAIGEAGVVSGSCQAETDQQQPGTSSTDGSSKSGGLAGPAIVGIIFAALVPLVAAIAVYLCWINKSFCFARHKPTAGVAVPLPATQLQRMSPPIAVKRTPQSSEGTKKHIKRHSVAAMEMVQNAQKKGQQRDAAADPPPSATQPQQPLPGYAYPLYQPNPNVMYPPHGLHQPPFMPMSGQMATMVAAGEGFGTPLPPNMQGVPMYHPFGATPPPGFYPPPPHSYPQPAMLSPTEPATTMSANTLSPVSTAAMSQKSQLPPIKSHKHKHSKKSSRSERPKHDEQ